MITGDGKKQYIQLPDSSYAEFPADLSDEEISNALSQAFPSNAPDATPTPAPAKPPSFWDKAMGRMGEALQAPYQKAGRGIVNLAKGDIPAGLAGLLSSAMAAPGAMMAPLAAIPGVNAVSAAMAKPGVEAWNEAHKTLSRDNPNFLPGRPALFSREAGEQANELGASSMGNLSALMAGEGAAAAGRGAIAMRPKIANALSEGAYKVPPTVKPNVREAIISTTQKYNVTPSKGGLAKLDAAKNSLTDLQTQMEDATRSGEPALANTNDILASIDPVIEQWKKGDLPKSYVAVLERYRQQVASQQNARLSMDDMISLKQNLQKQLQPLYNRAMKINTGVRQTILDEAKSAVEHEIRSRLEKMIPEYADVNSEIHKLIQTRPYVERAMNRINNYDILNLRDAAAGTMGAMVANNPLGAFAGVILEKILTHPRVWSAVANRLAGKVPPTFAAPVSTATGPTSPFGVSIPSRTLPIPSKQNEWINHPGGFQYRHLNEGE